jgi:shikimate 5'-dehydrogenase-like protein
MVRAFSRRSERWPNRRDSEPSSSVLVVPRERLRLSSRWLEHPRSGSQTAISPRRPTLRIWLTPPHRVPARPSDGEKTLQSRSWPPSSSTRPHWDCRASGEVRLDLDANSRDLLVCDVIPNPPDTSFPQRARQAGATTVDGRDMLLEQAAINIKLWTDIDSDREVMGSALDQAITDWAHP